MVEGLKKNYWFLDVLGYVQVVIIKDCHSFMGVTCGTPILSAEVAKTTRMLLSAFIISASLFSFCQSVVNGTGRKAFDAMDHFVLGCFTPIGGISWGQLREFYRSSQFENQEVPENYPGFDQFLRLFRRFDEVHSGFPFLVLSDACLLVLS